MRKRLLLLILAWLPLTGNPTWGQTPGIGANARQEKPNNAPNGAQAAAERGTHGNPLVVDTLGHQQTQVEREEAEQQAAEAEEDKQYHRGVDRWTLRWNGIAAIATAVLVLVGIGGTIAAVHTLRALKEQTNVSKQQMDLMIGKERARLDIELGKINIVRDEGGMWRFEVPITLKNIGNSRAYLGRVAFSLESGLNLPLSFSDEELEPVYLPAKVIEVDRPIRFSVPLDSLVSQLEAFSTEIAESTRKLYIRGTIKYETLGKEYPATLEPRVWAVTTRRSLKELPERKILQGQRSPENTAMWLTEGAWMHVPLRKS